MMAMIVGLILIGLGHRQARLRRRPAVEGGAGRLHERAGDHDHRRPAARSCAGSRPTPTASSTSCRRSSTGFDETQHRPRSCSASPRWPSCSLLPRFTTHDPGRARRRRRRHRGHGACSTSTSATVGALPQGLPRPALPWTDIGDVGPMLVAAIGITLVSLTDTIATSTSFAARRGDEVDPNQEMIGIGDGQHRRRVLPGLRRVDQRFADRRRRAVGRQEPAHRASSAPASSRCCCCSSAPCSPTCRRPRSPPS